MLTRHHSDPACRPTWRRVHNTPAIVHQRAYSIHAYSDDLADALFDPGDNDDPITPDTVVVAYTEYRHRTKHISVVSCDTFINIHRGEPVNVLPITTRTRIRDMPPDTEVTFHAITGAMTPAQRYMCVPDDDKHGREFAWISSEVGQFERVIDITDMFPRSAQFITGGYGRTACRCIIARVCVGARDDLVLWHPPDPPRRIRDWDAVIEYDNTVWLFTPARVYECNYWEYHAGERHGPNSCGLRAIRDGICLAHRREQPRVPTIVPVIVPAIVPVIVPAPVVAPVREYGNVTSCHLFRDSSRFDTDSMDMFCESNGIGVYVDHVDHQIVIASMPTGRERDHSLHVCINVDAIISVSWMHVVHEILPVHDECQLRPITDAREMADPMVLCVSARLTPHQRAYVCKLADADARAIAWLTPDNRRSYTTKYAYDITGMFPRGAQYITGGNGESPQRCICAVARGHIYVYHIVSGSSRVFTSWSHVYMYGTCMYVVGADRITRVLFDGWREISTYAIPVTHSIPASARLVATREHGRVHVRGGMDPRVSVQTGQK